MELEINEEEIEKNENNESKIGKTFKKKKKKTQKIKSNDYSFVFNQILNNYGPDLN